MQAMLDKASIWGATNPGITSDAGHTSASAKTLIADTTNNNVDNAIEITFTDDSAWRAAITAVKIGATTLAEGSAANQDYVISAGKITITPRAGGTAAARANGTWAITVEATNYANSTVNQVVQAGAVASMTVTTPAALGVRSGTDAVQMATQPVITLKDQFANTCTDGASATANVVVSKKADSTPGGATLGGTLTKAAVAGVATFTGLTVAPGSDAQITDLDLTFTSGTVTVDQDDLSTTA